MSPFLEEIAPRGSMLYYSLRHCSTEQKEIALAIQAFYRQIIYLIRTCQNQEVADPKLMFWQEEISLLYQDLPRHPITQTLLKWIKQKNIGQELWLSLLSEGFMLIKQPQIASWDDFILHAHHSASLREILLTQLFVPQTKEALAIARDLGVFFRIAEIILELRLDVQKGIIFIPQELLAEYHLNNQDFFALSHSSTIEKVLQHLHLKALDYLQLAQNAIKQQPILKKQLRSRLLFAEFHKRLLQIVAEEHYKTLQYHYVIPAIRLFWISLF